jgi:YVTN family beta-propeller protein
MNAVKRGVLALMIAAWVGGACAAEFLSPECLAVAPDGKTLYVTAATAGKLLLVDVASRKPAGEWSLPCDPTGVAVAADGTVYVSGGGANGVLYKLDAAGKVLARVATGHTLMSPVVAEDGATVYVLNRFDNNVAAVDAAKMKIKATVAVLREPHAAVLGAGGKLLFVANHLPAGRATDNVVAAAVSVIDTESFKLLDHVMLPNGSTGVRGIAAAPDGKHIYVTHTLGRYQMPTTQLERGWMNTNAMSIIDVQARKLLNTVLLDDADLGAANPWGVVVTPDGRQICVAHAGTSELSIIDAAGLMERLRKLTAAPNESVPHDAVRDAITVSATPDDVPNDLSFLAGLRRRIHLEGFGLRGLAIAGSTAYVAEYFSDAVAAVDLSTGAIDQIALGPKPQPSIARRGQMLFEDADLCFQHWQSCESCHPDARTDGLNWDLLNDGIGNPKNTRSMLLTQQGGPAMALGVRESSQAAVRAGMTHIQFAVHPEEEANAIDEYLKSLRPVPSPHLIDGRLSPAAQRGKKVFFDRNVGCSQCHPEPYYSDKLSHDVGSAAGLDRPTDKFNTPGLLEVWRTAPYLHDGRCLTFKELIVREKHGDKGGNLDGLSKRQIDDLAAFLLSL